ncbi:MAG: hypothetical protein Q8P41_10985 [Pseudomonadota bacterium]|nr:hypothetical protein [Pseudomonadota bacterium]
MTRRLLCEGDDRGPAAPVIRAILRGLPVVVEPRGSRGAFGPAVARDPAARALRDGDFPDDPAGWRPCAGVGHWDEAGVRLGWRWRRKEIENYLVDPEVLTRTFGWDAERRIAYDALLREALAACAERTAARMALLQLVPRFERPVVRRFDPTLAGAELEEELRRRHRRTTQAASRSEEELVARFRELRSLCLPGGPCHHPWVMAGKDLAGAFARLRGVRGTFPELLDTGKLGDSVIAALHRAEGPHRWLPEWEALRAEVEGWVGR